MSEDQPITDERPRADWTLSPDLVDVFVAGTATPPEEAALADEVARIMPYHAELPNPLVEALSRIMDKLGGEPGLWTWLDRHPGRPRTVARVYAVLGMLDRVGAEPAVATALAEYREQHPDPPDLAPLLVPATSIETLPGVSGEIELLLGEGRLDDAVRAAAAAVELLGELAPRVAELNPALRALGDEAAMARRVLQEAVAG
jgi:hypothetical protein